MKKIAILLIAVLLMSTLYLFAQAGSENDPLVTLSYINTRLVEFKNEIMSEVKAGSSNNTSGRGNANMAVFEIPEGGYPPGTRIAFGASTEFIVRRGVAEVYDKTTNNIPDLTTGVDIKHGEIVPLNHHLMVPREDGRGIVVKEHIWIMIKGPFVVIE